MPVQITGSIEGDTELNRRLITITDGLEDFSVPLQSISTEMFKSFNENFNARGGLFQGGWPPRKKDQSWPLLEKTGAMRDSFQQEAGTGYIRLFNTSPYFKYHQSNASRSRLPRRVMMKIDDMRRLFIVKEFQLYINDLMKAHANG